MKEKENKKEQDAFEIFEETFGPEEHWKKQKEVFGNNKSKHSDKIIWIIVVLLLVVLSLKQLDII